MPGEARTPYALVVANVNQNSGSPRLTYSVGSHFGRRSPSAVAARSSRIAHRPTPTRPRARNAGLRSCVVALGTLGVHARGALASVDGLPPPSSSLLRRTRSRSLHRRQRVPGVPPLYGSAVPAPRVAGRRLDARRRRERTRRRRDPARRRERRRRRREHSAGFRESGPRRRTALRHRSEPVRRRRRMGRGQRRRPTASPRSGSSRSTER